MGEREGKNAGTAADVDYPLARFDDRRKKTQDRRVILVVVKPKFIPSCVFFPVRDR